MKKQSFMKFTIQIYFLRKYNLMEKLCFSVDHQFVDTRALLLQYFTVRDQRSNNRFLCGKMFEELFLCCNLFHGMQKSERTKMAVLSDGILTLLEI